MNPDKLAKDLGVKPESARKALEGAAPILKELDRKRPKEVERPIGRYGNDEFGDPIHYDPALHPPGSVIESECSAFSTGGMYRPTEEELLEREFALWCGICGDPFETRKAFYAHRDDTHDGNAMFTNAPPEAKPLPLLSQRKNGRRADGEIRSTHLDPLGRVIVCRTDAQFRREADRHGHEIRKGRGER